MPRKNHGGDGNGRGSNKPDGRVIVVSDRIKQVDDNGKVHYPWEFLKEILGSENVECYAFPSCFLHSLRQEGRQYSCVFFDLPLPFGARKGYSNKAYLETIAEWGKYITKAKIKKYNLLNSKVPVYVYGREEYREKLLKAGATGFIVPKTSVAKNGLVVAILKELGIVDKSFKLPERRYRQRQPRPAVVHGGRVYRTVGVAV